MNRIHVDLKHVLIEQSKKLKYQALEAFLFSSIVDCLDGSRTITENEKNNLFVYIQNYVSFLQQKRHLVQKELKGIIFEAIAYLSDFYPSLADITSPKLSKNEIIERNIAKLNTLFVIESSKDFVKDLLQSHQGVKFFYETKYPYKKQLIKHLLQTELPEILEFLTFHPISSIGKSELIVTAEPKANQDGRPSIVYISSNKMPLFRKLTFEKELENYNVRAEISSFSQLSGTLTYLKSSEDRSTSQVSQGPAIRVGYILGEAKLDRLQSSANGKVIVSKYPIEFVPIDLRLPQKRKIDVILHKITDMLKKIEDPFYPIQLTNLQKLRENQNLLFLDPLESLEILSNRSAFQALVGKVFKSDRFLAGMKKLSQEKGKTFEFDVPKELNIDPKEVHPEGVVELVKSQKLKFPLVVKTTMASINKNSHEMAIALNLDGLLEIEKCSNFRENQHILQEYIEHDERIYKIYAVSSQAQISQKQSLPNLSEGTTESLFFFNSQTAIKDDPAFKKMIKGYKPEDIDKDVVKLMCGEINNRLKLSLVGFDLIKETKTGVYYLIDINYFPSFKGFAEFPETLHKHISTSYLNHMSQFSQSE